MISVQLRQALLQLMWDGGYQALDAGKPVERSTFDAMQKLIRHEPLEGEPPLPLPPPSGDPLATFRARQAIGQNCAWVLLTSAEEVALLALHGDVIHNYVNFYTAGGSGALGVNEIMSLAGGNYVFVGPSGTWEPDINGAADAYVATLAAAQGRTVPGPLV